MYSVPDISDAEFPFPSHSVEDLSRVVDGSEFEINVFGDLLCEEREETVVETAGEIDSISGIDYSPFGPENVVVGPFPAKLGLSHRWLDKYRTGATPRYRKLSHRLHDVAGIQAARLTRRPSVSGGILPAR